MAYYYLVLLLFTLSIITLTLGHGNHASPPADDEDDEDDDRIVFNHFEDKEYVLFNIFDSNKIYLDVGLSVLPATRPSSVLCLSIVCLSVDHDNNKLMDRSL